MYSFSSQHDPNATPFLSTTDETVYRSVNLDLEAKDSYHHPHLSFDSSLEGDVLKSVHGPASSFGLDLANFADLSTIAAPTFGSSKASSSSLWQAADTHSSFPTTKDFSSLSHKHLDLAALDFQSRDIEIPACPIYFETWSSFATDNADILSQITHYFTLFNVNFDFVADKSKIKGSFQENCNSCTFRVRLFQAPDGHGYLVEFQRRAGCVVTFNNLYRRTLQSAARHVSHMFGDVPMPSPSPLDDEPLEPLPVKLDEPSVRALYLIASSDYVDVQREGLRTLAYLSANDHNQSIIARHLLEVNAQNNAASATTPTAASKAEATSSSAAGELPQPICDLVATLLQRVSDNAESARHAVALLANICHSSELRPVILRQLLSPMLAVLQASGPAADLESREVRRHIARALDTLCAGGTADLVATLGGAEQSQQVLLSLSKLRASGDNVLVSTINDILRRFA